MSFASYVQKSEAASQKEPNILENPDQTDHQITTSNYSESTSTTRENEQDEDEKFKQIDDKTLEGQNGFDESAKKGKGNSRKLNHQTDHQKPTLNRSELTSTKRENEQDYDDDSKRINDKKFEGQNDIDESAKKRKGNSG
jgi:hypothetical protein